MYIGQVSYMVFEYFGMCRPLTWNSEWRIRIYHLYSIFMSTIYFIFQFSILIYLLRDTGNWVNNVETILHFVIAFEIWIKMITMMCKRKTIIDSKDILLDKICQPRDSYELEILQNCSEVCRSTTIVFLCMLIIAALLVLISPLSKGSNFPLPFKVWIPYNLESRLAYSLTYFFHGLAGITTAFVTGSVDSLAIVTMLKICAQLEIVVHRLHALPRLQKKNSSQCIIYERESSHISDNIDHHIYTYMLGEKLNELFGFVIFVQYFASMICLCTAIYALSKLSMNNPNSWRLIFLLFTSLIQIFLYCFYGDKMMEKSVAIAENICQMDWVNTTIKTQKKLNLIMIRARKPMKLCGFSLTNMTIETFVKIIKSAYSAYNLLKTI